MASPWVVGPAALLYALLVIPSLSTLLPLLASPQVASVAVLLGTPAGATIAWAHFVAFDLFVGRWVYLDSRERGITAWLVSPVLFLVFMLGPLGLLLYLIVRTLLRRNAQPAATSAAS